MRLAASASPSSSVSGMPGEQFLEQVDEARPRSLGGELVIADAVDLQFAGVGVGEAMRNMAVGVDLPVAAGLGQLVAQCYDLVGRDHRVIPAVECDHLGLDLLGRESRGVEKAVEADRRGEILAGAGEVERTLPAKTITGSDDLPIR